LNQTSFGARAFIYNFNLLLDNEICLFVFSWVFIGFRNALKLAFENQEFFEVINMLPGVRFVVDVICWRVGMFCHFSRFLDQNLELAKFDTPICQ